MTDNEVQKGILRFLRNHLGFEQCLYHIALNVYQLDEMPAGPIRESVNFHEFSHGILFQNIYGHIIFSLLYAAYDGISYCSTVCSETKFKKAWRVFDRCRTLAGVLLKGWLLTHEGYACLKGLDALRLWNSKNQTIDDINMKKRFERNFWITLTHSRNRLYRQAVALYEPFWRKDHTDLFTIASAGSSIFPIEFCRQYLTSTRKIDGPEIRPDDILVALNQYCIAGNVKIPGNVEDIIEMLKVIAPYPALHAGVTRDFSEFFAYDFLPYLYLELDWPIEFKSKGYAFLEHIEKVMNNNKRRDKIHLNKVTMLPYQVRLDIDMNGRSLLKPEIRCGIESKEIRLKDYMVAYTRDLNDILQIITCIDSNSSSPVHVYKALKQLGIRFPDFGFDVLYTNIPIASQQN